MCKSGFIVGPDRTCHCECQVGPARKPTSHTLTMLPAGLAPTGICSLDAVVLCMCAGPKGTFFDNNECKSCPIGHYCPGGYQTAATMTACGTGLTTRGVGRSSVTSCSECHDECPCIAPSGVTVGSQHSSLHVLLLVPVNLPGYYYRLSGNSNLPEGVPCPANTYGPGRMKQGACSPCPPGECSNEAGGGFPVILLTYTWLV